MFHRLPCEIAKQYFTGSLTSCHSFHCHYIFLIFIVQKEKKIHIEDIGCVHFIQNSRIKNINISIKPFKGVRVSFPMFVSFKNAEQVVYKKQEWIKTHSDKIKDIESNKTIFNKNSVFKTRKHILEINQHNDNKISVNVNDTKIFVNYPIDINIKNENVQKAIRRGIEKAWELEAYDILPERLEYLAKKTGLFYKDIVIKNLKSRWGSCSHDNIISLSVHLMNLPDHLIDYVLLHELVHTVEKSHNKNFWISLQKVTDNAKELKKQMKHHKIGIY